MKIIYKRPTEREYGHSDVYVTEVYIGYIIKDHFNGYWYFESRNRCKISTLQAETRKELIHRLTTEINKKW